MNPTRAGTSFPVASSRIARAAVISAVALVVVAVSSVVLRGKGTAEERRIGMAVELMNHAAAAYVAQDKGWYEARGLRLSSYRSYVTGMALAAALARQDIQVAYMCLVPAISAYANARVPIKIVAGTHKYGYALLVNPDVVTRMEDLAGAGVRIGCVREGGAADVLLRRTIESYQLDRREILSRVRRMNPPRLLIALKTGQLDAACLPEQWASMAEDLGFQTLLSAKDVWPQMQGSVLVVKEELLRQSPEQVRKLVAVNEEATRWVNQHPAEAARTLARVLTATGEKEMPAQVAALAANLAMNPDTMRRSMGRLEYTSAISVQDVQDVIDYMAEIGYLKKSFPAEEIVDTRFLP